MNGTAAYIFSGWRRGDLCMSQRRRVHRAALTGNFVGWYFDGTGGRVLTLGAIHSFGWRASCTCLTIRIAPVFSTTCQCGSCTGSSASRSLSRRVTCYLTSCPYLPWLVMVSRDSEAEEEQIHFQNVITTIQQYASYTVCPCALTTHTTLLNFGEF